MKKRTALILFASIAVASVSLVCAWPSIYLHLADIHIVDEGVENYHPALSSTGLCAYLTVRDGRAQARSGQDIPFVDDYAWSKAFFRYEELTYGGLCHETALLALSYDDGNYAKAFGDVSSQPGFSTEISFSYGVVEFRLNDTERILSESSNSYVYTNYELTGDAPYLNWINLVGWSEAHKTIYFVGFHHAVERRAGFWKIEKSYYPFTGWGVLLEEEFSFFDWAESASLSAPRLVGASASFPPCYRWADKA